MFDPDVDGNNQHQDQLGKDQAGHGVIADAGGIGGEHHGSKRHLKPCDQGGKAAHQGEIEMGALDAFCFQPSLKENAGKEGTGIVEPVWRSVGNHDHTSAGSI